MVKREFALFVISIHAPRVGGDIWGAGWPQYPD